MSSSNDSYLAGNTGITTGAGYGYDTTEPPDPRDYYSNLELVIFQILITVVSVCGVVGNVLVTAVVCCFRRWRQSTNLFLASIAVADLVICVWTLPVMVTSINKGRWALPLWMCGLGGFLDNASYFSSSWSLALGALERLYMILSRGRTTGALNYSVAFLLVCCVWMFSAVVASLPVLGWNRYVYSPLTFSCAIDAFAHGIHKYYFIMFLVLTFPIPLIIISICYTYVFYFIIKHMRAREKRKHLSLVIPLIIITIAFVLCSLPTTVICIVLLLQPTHRLGTLKAFHYALIHWVLLANSCLNPIICAFMSKKFRDNSRELIFCLGHTIEFYLTTCIFSTVYNTALHIKYLTVNFCTTWRRNLRKGLSSVKKTVAWGCCGDPHDDIIIKVTIDNTPLQQGESLDPLLLHSRRSTLTTDINDNVSSVSTERRQSGSNNRRRSSSGEGVLTGRVCTDKNNLINDDKNVILEEQEPFLVWCTCGEIRCICLPPPTTTPV